MSVSEATTIKIHPIKGSKLENEVAVPAELNVLEDNDTIPEHHCCFRILSEEKGDDRIVWDSRSFDEIREAKKLFIDLVKKGLTPYKVGINGQATSEVMTEFDATAEEVIFLPTQVVAGG